MPRFIRSLAASGALLLAACTESAPFDPAAAGDGGTALQVATAVGRVTFMTRNMYIGADVDAVIAALASPDPNDDLPTLLAAIQTLQATDFSARAAAMASEIARNRPHAVGLQEVTQLDIDLTGLGLPVVIHEDFLAILLADLKARGVHYRVAAEVTNTQATPIPGISLVDHDALLVDPDRVSILGGVVAQNFSNNIGVVAPGVEIKRGWVAVQARIDGTAYTIASTHLESGGAPGLDQLRAAQAAELATSLGAASPTIVLGDLNDGPASLMHQVLVGAGLSDLWTTLQPGTDGFTCCQLPDLSNPRATFNQRIDYVFTRGVGVPTDGFRGQVTRIGYLPADRIRGPLHLIWPSDHAGLVATLPIPPAALAQR